MEIVVKLIVSLGVVAIFFAFYFRHFVFRRSVVLQSRGLFYGILSAAAALALQLYVLPILLPDNRPKFSRALIDAAFIEEAVRLCFLMYYLRFVAFTGGGKNSSNQSTFTVVEGVFDGILLGLGFALVENLHYGLSYPGYVILLRSLTSAPLHAFMGGIMAFFLSYGLLRDTSHRSGRPSLRSMYLYAAAFGLPFTLHAAYDLGFVLGSFAYAVPLVLIASFLITEYCMQRARLYFGRNVLGMIGIDVDDLEVYLYQLEYEKWLGDRQDEDRPEPELFHRRRPGEVFKEAAGGVGLVVLALAAAVYYLLDPGAAVFRSLPSAEIRISLLMVYPALTGSMLIFTDVVNMLYLRDRLLSVPMPIQVLVERDGAAYSTVALDVLPAGVFISDAERLEQDEEVRLTFETGRLTSGPYTARLRWANRLNPTLPFGHLLRFEHRNLSFFWFRLRYKWMKLHGKSKVFG